MKVPDKYVRAMRGRQGMSMAVGNEGAGRVIKAGSSAQAQALLGRSRLPIQTARHTNSYVCLCVRLSVVSVVFVYTSEFCLHCLRCQVAVWLPWLAACMRRYEGSRSGRASADTFYLTVLRPTWARGAGAYYVYERLKMKGCSHTR